jgi:Rrf2 family cysteine metabolism transcriptional repressor
MRLSSLDVHAFAAVGHLAAHPDRWVPAAEICQHHRLARPYTLQILAWLSRADLVRSKRGMNGGYQLGRAAQDISLRDIVVALNRPVAPLSCVSQSVPASCALEDCCQMRRSVYSELQRHTHALLARFSAADLARDVQAGVTFDHCLHHLWHPSQDGGFGRLVRSGKTALRGHTPPTGRETPSLP